MSGRFDRDCPTLPPSGGVFERQFVSTYLIMTDHHAMQAALAAVDPSGGSHVIVRRNSRNFMALPASRTGAIRALKLYQPQRLKAVLAVYGLRMLVSTGLHRFFLPRFHNPGDHREVTPGALGCLPGTTGVMLGSPEHEVRRAILSYETADGWEVAKVAFGPKGRSVTDGEHSALISMPTGTPGVPTALGLHHGDELSMLRLPYLQGVPFRPGSVAPALALLESWIRDLPERRASDFPEWPAIASALETTEGGRDALTRLAGIILRPVIRHGDFARWNLLQLQDLSCMAIDWEWGNPEGLPGLDLVHFILQDHRLVNRMSDRDAIAATLRELDHPGCRSYLEKTGWTGDPILPVIASLAWKQGAAHQENATILGRAVSMKNGEGM